MNLTHKPDAIPVGAYRIRPIKEQIVLHTPKLGLHTPHKFK